MPHAWAEKESGDGQKKGTLNSKKQHSITVENPGPAEPAISKLINSGGAKNGGTRELMPASQPASQQYEKRCSSARAKDARPLELRAAPSE